MNANDFYLPPMKKGCGDVWFTFEGRTILVRNVPGYLLEVEGYNCLLHRPIRQKYWARTRQIQYILEDTKWDITELTSCSRITGGFEARKHCTSRLRTYQYAINRLRGAKPDQIAGSILAKVTKLRNSDVVRVVYPGPYQLSDLGLSK